MFMLKSFEKLNESISAENNKYLVPKCSQLSLIDECIFYECSKKTNEDNIGMVENSYLKKINPIKIKYKA